MQNIRMIGLTMTGLRCGPCNSQQGTTAVADFDFSSYNCFSSIFLLAKASFSAYVLVKHVLKTGEKVHFSTKKSTTNFGLRFCFFPFLFFCLKMAKICCFRIAKSKKSRQKTGPPPFFDPIGNHVETRGIPHLSKALHT